MNERKNIQLNNTQKSTVTITGTLSLPLRPGERAWFRTSQQLFMTSTVQTILEVSESGVKFETCNTIYDLEYTVLISCLKDLRIQSKMTQQELSTYLGCSQAYISKYEKES